MKKILCFGDSNTWGCSPVDSTRFDENTRWPKVMGSILGENCIILEEGLNGRTVLNLSPVNVMANGIECISLIIGNCLPVDIVLISLGLNDVFIAEDSTLLQISDGIGKIIDAIRSLHLAGNYSAPEIIIMSPPEFNTAIEGIQFFELQVNKLKGMPDIYRKLAEDKHCLFFNSSEYVKGSDIDGSHLEAESHILLGKIVADFVMSRIK